MKNNRLYCIIALCGSLFAVTSQVRAGIGVQRPPVLLNGGAGVAAPGAAEARTGIDVSGTAQLLTDNSGMVTRDVDIDLQDGTVTVTEAVNGVPVRHPFSMPLEPYITRLARAETDRAWRYMDPATEDAILQKGYLQVDIPVEFPKAISRHIGSGGQLRVSGYRKIEFAGHSQWTTEQQTDYKEGTAGWIPNLEMEQESEFKIEGKIGDKIHVYVDQSTERLSEMENSIKINYTGDEDEIIQSIEAGNTSLSLPNTHFVSANEKHKGLFGIKVKMKIGYLDLTAIASQQKGAAEKKSIPLGASLEEQIIKDYNYKKRTYYSLGDPGLDITDVDVFAANTGERANDYDTAFVFVESRERPYGIIDTLVEVKPVKLQDGASPDYEFVPGKGAYIRFTNRKYIGEKWLLGVTYTYKDNAGNEYTVGGIEGRNVRLQLIKSVDPDTTLRAWDYEWKNVYDLGSGGVDEDGFTLDIYRQPDGGGDAQPAQGDVRYIKLLGLDNDGNGQVDKTSRWIDFRRGELVFPYAYPFNSDTLDAEDRVPAIYESPRKFEASKSRFFMKVQSRSVKKTYDLGYMNIIKGSEAVMLDGVKLSSSAYTIRYETGQITFRTDDVYKPGADVSVTFEYMPFFTPDQKTLLGMRAELKFWENSHVGFTGLYKRQTTLDRRIQLGREPTQGLIWDVDAAFNFKPKWMTRMVDALPLISTEAQSALEVSGEFAQSYSDPNTEGEAIIDDFEGSRLSTDLGIIRNTWTDASRPDTSFGQAFPASFYGPGADSTWMAYKGTVNWFNPVGTDRVKVIDIWPERAEDVYTVDDEQNVLKVRFAPEGNDTLSWGGLMQYLYEGYHDQTEAKYLELWVRGGTGTVTFDLGRVSEDVIPNGELDTEDKNDDGILSEDEDVGLDGIPNGEPGDTDDNYRYTPGTLDYTRINGTEGNFDDPLRYNRFDTEDLSGDFKLDIADDYFTVTVDLADTQYVVPGTYAWDRKKAAERDPDFGRTADWRLYRIPLWNIADNPLNKVGNPQTYLIKYARMWFTGFNRADSVSFASLEIVGNEWLEQAQTGADTAEFNVSVKNAYENADYEMPEPVRKKYEEELNTFETETATFNEQSLAITFDGLMPGRSVAAYNDNMFQELDFTNYRTLKFYLNGVDAPTDGSVDFFIRFGSDSSNYYGIRVVPEGGWSASNPKGGWKSYTFDLAKLTTLKLKSLGADSLERALAGGAWRMTADDAVYEVRGNPTMSAVDWMQVGVAHDQFSAGAARGEIWLDDLILADPKKETGRAARLSLNTVLADLGRFSGHFEYRDDGFRALNESVESLREQRRTTMSGNLSMGRFFPKQWGISLPVTGTINESEDLPRFKPGTDIELVNDQDRDDNRTQRISRRATVAFKKNGRSQNPLLAYTVDRLDFDYTVSHQFNRYTRPSARIDTTKEYEASLRYNLTPSKKPALRPLGLLEGRWMPKKLTDAKLYYLPNNLNSQFALRHTYTKSEDQVISIPSIDTVREFTSKYEVGYMPLAGLNLTYGLDLVHDARGHLTGEQMGEGDLSLGDELQRTQDLSVQFRPNLFQFWSQSYTYRVNYDENAHPDQIALSGTDTRDIRWSRDYGLDYTWSFMNLKKLLPAKTAVKAKLLSGAWLAGYLKNGMYYSGELLPSVTTRYKMTENATAYSLTGRPDAAFQFGFEDKPGVPAYSDTTAGNTSTTARNADSRKEQKDLGVTSSLRAGPVNLQASYDYAFKNNVVYDKMTYDRTQTLPRLTLQVRSLEKLPYLEKVVRTSTMNSSYSRDITESGELDARGSWLWYVDGDRTREKLTIKDAFSPLLKWSLQWKNKVSTTIDYQRTKEQSRSFEGTNKRSRRRNQTLSLTTQYSFSAPHGIKFWKLKNIKFNRSLNTSITISTGGDVKDYLLEGDDEYTEEEAQSNWSVNTQAKYSFSSKVEGGLQILASQNRKRLPTKLTNNEAKLAIWAQLKF